MLRTDNGGDFCGNEFEDFRKKCGIARKNTTPYTPQLNGVVKRMNRTLMEKERIMISSDGIGTGPNTSLCINSRIPFALVAPYAVLLDFVFHICNVHKNQNPE